MSILRLRFVLPIVSSLPLALFVFGCSSQDNNDANACTECGADASIESGALPDSGVESGGEVGAHDSSLDATKDASPDVATCVPDGAADLPDDDFKDTNCDGIDGDKSKAVFVAPSGSDTADGSITSPVRTLTKAIQLAVANKRDIYVCSATYTENLSIDKTAVSVYGGYDCSSGWSRKLDPAIVAPTAGEALSITDVPGAMRIERMSFQSADVLLEGGSSVAGVIANSPNVALRHDFFAAGSGGDGEVGVAGTPKSQPALDGEDGESTLTRCDEPYTGQCLVRATGGHKNPGGTCSVGGFGGDGGTWNLSPLPGQQGMPNGAAGGASGGGGVGDNGGPGKNGLAASNGIGHVENTKYVSSNDGGNGGRGADGKAGGGGAGSVAHCQNNNCSTFNYFYRGPGGGQGGFGGCGGEGGYGGKGGGASLALLLSNAPISVSNCSFTTSAGGRGGAPGAGASGQVGGKGGSGGMGKAGSVSSPGAGAGGGYGGNGGPGGAGGPGGGGPSIAILVGSGAQPTISGAMYYVGAGGKGGQGVGGGDGPDGKQGEIVSLSQTDAGADAQ